jgi:phage protein D
MSTERRSEKKEDEEERKAARERLRRRATTTKTNSVCIEGVTDFTPTMAVEGRPSRLPRAPSTTR